MIVCPSREETTMAEFVVVGFGNPFDADRVLTELSRLQTETGAISADSDRKDHSRPLPLLACGHDRRSGATKAYLAVIHVEY
jgi:hypothetical protein